MEISELHRIANSVFDQREKLREEEKERKEAEKERERNRKRRTERRENLKMFVAMQNEPGIQTLLYQLISPDAPGVKKRS